MQKLERILGIPSADFFVFVFVFFFSNLKRHEFRSESFGFVPFSWVVLAGRAPGNRSLLELNVSSAFVVMCEPSAVFLVTHWLACWKVFLKTRLFDCNWCTEATLDVASSYAVSVVTETKKNKQKTVVAPSAKFIIFSNRRRHLPYRMWSVGAIQWSFAFRAKWQLASW